MADLPTKINLTIVTRERKIVDVQVDEVILPGYDGELGILPGHTPLLALLKIGELRYRSGATWSRMVISWGVAAEKELAYLSSHDPEFAIVEARLEESVAMINLGKD